MATHTENGSGSFGRKFSISRENGLHDKNGRPYFFEWIHELPAETGKRKFETRQSGNNPPRHYELFSALDGYLIGVDIISKAFNGTEKTERWLGLQMIDAQEEYSIEIGPLDGRYSMDIMKRLLDPNFNPNFKLRISPYCIEDNGKYNIGISAISGVDTKLSAKYDAPQLVGMPQAESVVFKGETKWDFTAVSLWLYEQIKTRVVPGLMVDPIAQPERKPLPAPSPINTNIKPNHDANFPTTETVFEDATTDDLPF